MGGTQLAWEGNRGQQGFPRERADSPLPGLRGDEGGRDIENLISRVEDIEGQRGGLVYSTHKQKFGAVHDVQKFTKEKGVDSCGSYWDLFSVLIRMGGRKQSGTQLAQSTFAASRLQTSWNLISCHL